MGFRASADPDCGSTRQYQPYKPSLSHIQTSKIQTIDSVTNSSLFRSAPAPKANATAPLPGPRTHRHTSSVSSIPYHPPVSPENYVRTQHLGSRGAKSFDSVAHSPTISGGLTRQLSVTSSEGEVGPHPNPSAGPGPDEAEAAGADPSGPIKKNRRKSWSDMRRLRGRSESMPILAPKEVEELRREAAQKDLAALPPNVK